MSKDWFRRKSWLKSDQEEFFTKLNRARKDSRPQYLKIQAIEFEQTGKMDLLNAAEDLLNQLLSDFPEDKFNKSSAYYTLGSIYKQRNDLETALSYFKKAIDFEEIYPNIKTQADLDFSDLVVKLEKLEYYAKAQKLMEARVECSLFPVEKYRGYSILAIISMRNGDQLNFQKFKKLAMENASLQSSGLSYHQKLGIVEKRDSWLDRILNSL